MLKYTYVQKAKSVLGNILKASPTDICKYIFARLNKKYRSNIEAIFAGDNTTESDYDPRDYTLSGTEVKELPILQRIKVYMVDQGRAYRTRNACVPFNILLAICNNLDIRPDYKEFEEWLNWLEAQGKWRENWGANIPTVVKAICTRWNELHPDRKVRYDRFYYNNKALGEALTKGYEVVGGRNTFSAYTIDKRDGKISFDNYEGWKRAGGHCLNIMLGKILDGKKQIEIQPNNTEKEVKASVKSHYIHGVNSYPTTHQDLNLYEHNRLGAHCKNLIWYSWFYLIHEADPKPQTPPKVVDTPKVYKPVEGNRYYHFLEKYIDEGFEPTFEDYFEKAELNAGEVKTLQDLQKARDWKASQKK